MDINSDLTPTVQAQGLVSDYQTCFKTFFEQSSQPMEIYSRDGLSRTTNNAWSSEFKDYHLPEESFKKALEGESLKIPATLFGSRWIEASVMPLKDPQGRIHEIVVILNDVTENVETHHALIKTISERVEAEADQKFLSEASELLNSSLDYREILKSLGDFAANYFCDGIFVDQLLNSGEIKRIVVVHKNPEVVKKLKRFDDDFPNRYENNPAVDTVITGKTLFVEDTHFFWEKQRSVFGEKYHAAVMSIGIKSNIRVRLKGRESILGTISFFTDENSEKKLLKRHIWLAEELGHRVSMAFENSLVHQASQDAIRSRDEFLSIASHELKTPLQSLTLQNQMRKRNLTKKLLHSFSLENLSSMIEADLRQLMRINRLIDDMLDISRIRAGKLTFIKEKVEFCEFVKDVLERFRPQLDSVGCHLTVLYCEPVWTHMDRYRIEQVIVNLLTNAMKYGAGKPVRVEILKKSDKLQMHVHDKGPGIREEDSERIFERFERAISSNEVSGLGLGLYISRQIMEQNEGQLSVRSHFGQGSTFIMELSFEN